VSSTQGAVAPFVPSKSRTLSPGQVVLLFMTVLAVIVALTLVLAFHYSKASDAVSVLGVAMPVLTAAIGAALGGGAGNAVGAAGKKGVQQDLDQANQTLDSAGTEIRAVKSKVDSLISTLKEGLDSPPNESRLLFSRTLAGDQADQDVTQGVDTASLDEITSGLSRLDGLVNRPALPPVANDSGAGR
jgi:hypothetical protein